MKIPRVASFLKLVAVIGLIHVGCNFSWSGLHSEVNDVSLSKASHASIKRDIGPNSIIFSMEKAPQMSEENAGGGTQRFTQGPHQVTLKLKNSRGCKDPRFSIRMTGNALVYLNLKEEKNGVWKGSFTFPIEGSYSVDARWYGCEQPDLSTSWSSLSEPLEIVAVDTPGVSLQPNPLGLFADSAWISTGGHSNNQLPEYLWKPVKTEMSEDVLQLKETAVLELGTSRQVGKQKYHQFADLGNYELLCFLGSRTMHDIREKFLEIRPHIFPRQRPFKFHYYNVTNLLHPDTYWTTDQKQRLRKCKHILVSVDELDKPISQSEYKKQFTSFVGHLLKVMDDDTFPIRLFTNNEPPARTQNCYNPVGSRTTDHPCNEVLRELFRSNVFPERVHLLDNTDVTLPLLDWDEGRTHALSVVALRVFVFVGKQVADWRAMGQKGMIDGLHRNGVVEPNFELIPYTGWA